MPKAKQLPSIEYLKECFELLPNGSLQWKNRPQNHFPSRSYQFKIWNSAWAGKIADVDMLNGYYSVCINRVRYKSHRIVYAIANGGINQNLQVDHKNGITKDNRPENLRLATQSQNTVNFKGARKDGVFGQRGISWKEKNKKWQVTLTVNGSTKYIGLFENKEDAINAAKQSRKDAFGEFWESQNG